MKLDLDTGKLVYKSETIVIDVERSDHCEHYDVLMLSSEGMIFGLHIKTIEELYALPFKWEEFVHMKHPEGQIVGLVSLD